MQDKFRKESKEVEFDENMFNSTKTQVVKKTNYDEELANLKQQKFINRLNTLKEKQPDIDDFMNQIKKQKKSHQVANQSQFRRIKENELNLIRNGKSINNLEIYKSKPDIFEQKFKQMGHIL